MAPLRYVIQKDVAIANPAPVLAPDQPYSTTHGSVCKEMTMRFSHTHALCSDDNGKVFDDLELATRSTKFAASIAPFKRTKMDEQHLLL